jgi:hypothetical protein
VNVYVSGDEPESSQQPANAPAPVPAPTSHDVVVGDLDVSFFAFLRHEDGSGFQLGARELFAQQLSIDGSEERLVQVQFTPEGQYTEVRLHFTQVSANVVSGLPVLGEVSVDIPTDTTLLVARSIDLDLAEDEEVDLVVDLNAAAWLLTANPLTGIVDPEAFAALVEVSLR